MLTNLIKILLLNGFACLAFADPQSVFCPQKSGYINIGMTVDQVIAACGQPISQQKSDQPAMQQVPIKQVFFNNQGQSTAFYGVWAIPGGSGNYGAYQPFGTKNGGAGSQLEIDIANNEVRSVKLNGSDTNAISICGSNISVGDPASKIYACGTPNLVNTTYINVPIPGGQKPIIWVYQMGQYEKPMTLTFINGQLHSIQ
ncbi:MAG: hypothetical protein A3F46_07625 [Legionellales bacterium RIFCSPHIGHO2_12_FULL_42_9]|nr:MAG: hypothetical protein A3F46_07625 [Legionellales bacterium RIFCSPHIGHO2_12_FULL_42_9]